MENKNDIEITLYTLWHMPQAIAAIIHLEDTEPDGRHCSETVNDTTALIMSRSATAKAPPCIMCHPGRD